MAEAPSPFRLPDFPRTARLTAKEQKELDGLPTRIERLEAEQAELSRQLADPALYKGDPAKPVEVKARLSAVDAEHAAAFAQWEKLEARRAGG